MENKVFASEQLADTYKTARGYIKAMIEDPENAQLFAIFAKGMAYQFIADALKKAGETNKIEGYWTLGVGIIVLAKKLSEHPESHNAIAQKLNI